MPMMRRGPLDRYPPEWVLRQANAHAATGGLEFHTDRPLTFHLLDGRLYGAAEGVGPHAVAHPAADELGARRHVVELLSDVLGRSSGWYYLDPLGEAPTRGAWSWETASLLMETRARVHEDRTLVEWTDRTVALRDTDAAGVALGADGWAVVVAMASSTTTDELSRRLGWTPARLLAALTEIEQRGVLDPGSARRPDPLGVAGPAAATTAPSPGTRRHHGPLAPPPPISAAALVTPITDATGERSRLRRRRGAKRADA
jgi:hypothetical protein